MSEAPHMRILIADDHPVTREGLALILAREADFRIVAECANGRDAVEQFFATEPDIGLMDLQMPIMSGAEAIENILRREKNAKIIVLTTYDGDEDIYRAMHAGAKAYLLKDTPRQELIAVIRSVFQGHRFVAPQMGAKLAQRVLCNALTVRELDVLNLVYLGKANKAIAIELNISEGTVRTHVTNLMDKLGACSRTEAAMLAVKRGLLRR
jgi:two-component system NarL family response regulator